MKKRIGIISISIVVLVIALISAFKNTYSLFKHDWNFDFLG